MVYVVVFERGLSLAASQIYQTREAAQAYIMKDYYTAQKGRFIPGVIT